ncbi:hypothetical protein MTO96_011471 [Rhipicephalus appendiculatus]
MAQLPLPVVAVMCSMDSRQGAGLTRQHLVQSVQRKTEEMSKDNNVLDQAAPFFRGYQLQRFKLLCLPSPAERLTVLVRQLPWCFWDASDELRHGTVLKGLELAFIGTFTFRSAPVQKPWKSTFLVRWPLILRETCSEPESKRSSMDTADDENLKQAKKKAVATGGRGGTPSLADLFPFSASPNVSEKEERRATLVFLLVFAAMLAASAGGMLLVLLLVHLLSDKEHGAAANDTVYETTNAATTNGSNAAVIGGL